MCAARPVAWAADNPLRPDTMPIIRYGTIPDVYRDIVKDSRVRCRWMLGTAFQALRARMPPRDPTVHHVALDQGQYVPLKRALRYFYGNKLEK
jgi:hypothetical protein